MDGQVKDVRIGIRQILDAVTVMDVPIKDEDTFGTARVVRIFGRDSNIVEIAKTFVVVFLFLLFRKGSREIFHKNKRSREREHRKKNVKQPAEKRFVRLRNKDQKPRIPSS